MPDADLSGKRAETPLPEALLPEPAEDARLLAEAARAAGRLALAYFGRDPEVWTKEGNSPVSEADIAADNFLREHLMAARPDYGWLSEESADTPDRLQRRRVFVVDPIDGTRAFIAGDKEWAVSAAVVEDGRPIAAALYQPVTDDLWVSALGLGARRGNVGLEATARASLDGARVTGPRRYLKHPEMHRHGLEPRPFVPSLALRLAYVADGRLDVAFGSSFANDWDLAAADLLVHEAGGTLTTLEGQPVRYNAVVPRHPPLVAAVPGLVDTATELLARVAETDHTLTAS